MRAPHIEELKLALYAPVEREAPYNQHDSLLRQVAEVWQPLLFL
jgi:hypothetical protein